MYFLSDIERKLLIHRLLPTARTTGVSTKKGKLCKLSKKCFNERTHKTRIERIKEMRFALLPKVVPMDSGIS